MSHFTVIFDACVLYPAPMRDLLMTLAVTRQFRARWTDQIHDEWTRSVLEDRADLTREQLERTVTLMNSAVPDCLVSGYEPLIDCLKLPDPDDRHVLAAAIRAKAAAIVTTNLKDFPKGYLSEFDIFPIHPDDFVMDLADLHPVILELAAKQMRARLGDPPYPPEEFVDNLRRQGLPQVADFLDERIGLI